MAVALAALASAAALAALAGPSAAALSPDLETRLETAAPDAQIAVIATLSRQVDGDAYDGRPAALIRALKRTADRTQDAVADDVDGPVRGFWLVNAVTFRASPAEIREVAADPAVAIVEPDRTVRLADAEDAAVPTPFPDPGTGNWGLATIHAPAVWAAYGLRGAGVRVGTIDTGVDASNPDLSGKVVAWRDFVSGGAAPYDDNGHGTHTAGTIAGGNARGAAIGVAPDARLVVARAMGANGVGPGSALLAAAEWMTDPDGNPATADQPSVINNSWSAPNANDTWFRPMIQRWLELGIVPVFAAGNTGPSAGTVGSPAGYPEALAVGAIDTDDTVAPFSGRGPIVWQNPDGDGPAAGTVLTKPDLAAPGVGIVSSVGSGYLAYSGTSMASPHVAGVAALVRQANPSLSAPAVEDLLRSTAVDIGAGGPDAATGAGRVDAVRAVEAAMGPMPDTRFARTPAAVTRDTTLHYSVVLSGGGVTVRTRVDGGAWSAPDAQLERDFTLPQGRHVVEAQAVDAAGAVDPSPARHVVTIDRTRPRVSMRWFVHGTRTLFRARITGAPASSARWSFGDGDTAAGARVARRFAESRARRIVLSARDAAGNEAFAVRSLRPPAAAAVRALRVPATARRGRPLAVTGRVVRAARLEATLRPVLRAAETTAAGPAAYFATQELGGAVSRARLPSAWPGTFRLTLPLGRLRPGTYRLEIHASEAGTTIGRLPLVRRVEIR
jgi:subtilisin family serine protease